MLLDQNQYSKFNFFSQLISQNAQKLLSKRKVLPPLEINVYKNEMLENALRNGSLDKYKVRKNILFVHLKNFFRIK